MVLGGGAWSWEVGVVLGGGCGPGRGCGAGRGMVLGGGRGPVRGGVVLIRAVVLCGRGGVVLGGGRGPVRSWEGGRGPGRSNLSPCFVWPFKIIDIYSVIKNDQDCVRVKGSSIRGLRRL